MTYEITQIAAKEIFKGFHARFIHTEQTTLAFVEIEAGAVLPMHSHVHEQITQVWEGQLELTIEGESKVYEKGMVAVIPSHAKHAGVALTTCKVFDIFCPVREDYR
ncbi:MAG: cupin domain-containing protein [Saprospiraceae bacterium]